MTQELHSDEVEVARGNGREYERLGEDHWVYKGTRIRVPGARDKKLSERFHPRLIHLPGEEPDQLIVAAQDIDEAPDDLGWCREVGIPVPDPKSGALTGVIVDYGEWQSRDRLRHSLTAPEVDGTEAEKKLADIERRVREEQEALADLIAERTDFLRATADGELTRKRAAEILDLTPSRIQQMIAVDQDIPVVQSTGTIKERVLEVLTRAGPLSHKQLNLAFAPVHTGKKKKANAATLRAVQRALNELAEEGRIHQNATGFWAVSSEAPET